MGKAREVDIQVGVYENEFYVITPTDEERTLSIGSLSLVHIFSDDQVSFPMRVKFYRLIPMIDGCSIDYRCTCYGETCDYIWLPPGEYEYEVCDDRASKYMPDGIYTVTLVIEEPSSDFILAEQLNSGC